MVIDMENVKIVKVKESVWMELMHLRIEMQKNSINDVIAELLEKYDYEYSATVRPAAVQEGEA